MDAGMVAEFQRLGLEYPPPPFPPPLVPPADLPPPLPPGLGVSASSRSSLLTEHVHPGVVVAAASAASDHHVVGIGDIDMDEL